MESYVKGIAQQAKAASRLLASLSSEQKNRALLAMAQAIEENVQEILAANAEDVQAAKEKGISGALLDRLTLTPQRVQDMADGLRDVAALPDPVGEIEQMWLRPNGLQIGRMRVPLGVVGVIYEARPNVTVDAAGLCLKSGNAVVLRGSGEALNSNRMITQVISRGAVDSGLPEEAVGLIDEASREGVTAMLKLNECIDVLIPRGGAGLIRTVVDQATIPVIATGMGNCHIYIDRAADLNMALEVVLNAKTQRPGVCNAVETLLVHEEVAEALLPRLAEKLAEAGVEVRGCARSLEIVPQWDRATEEDWDTEYLDLILAVRVVDGYDTAVEHITRHGTQHSECIITQDYSVARRFLREVDAAAVYVNASTRFTDGGQFGLGAEMGISTQKLHARGPMGLRELTTVKYIILGEGQVRR
ncbi:MAG TPA: glutamate-5-semialdehyde dehydrogenase [Firmicutes bacterium]|nr:glutamate-5-semialdehyde dehydrogenase [Bacillota bacterium]